MSAAAAATENKKHWLYRLCLMCILLCALTFAYASTILSLGITVVTKVNFKFDDVLLVGDYKPDTHRLLQEEDTKANQSTIRQGAPSTSCNTTTYGDFNMCVALDMSGSVCNQDTGFECMACLPDMVCNTIFNSEDKAMCCDNFQEMVDFTKDIVNELSQNQKVEQSYSIVGFNDDSKLVMDMANAEDTLLALEEIV